MVTVTDPCGTMVIWYASFLAKKATLRGTALSACGHGDFWDERLGSAKKEAARIQLRQLHHQVVTDWNDYIDQMTLVRDDVSATAAPHTRRRMLAQRVVSGIFPPNPLAKPQPV